jgi:raffinose/stachyose/melibiose transport system substrate-binding protein
MSYEKKVSGIVSRRQMLRLIGLSAGATALAACAAPAPPAAAPAEPAAPAPASGESAAPTTAPAEAGAQKVIWWDIQTTEPNKPIFDTIVANFNKLDAKVQVEKQTIQNDPFKTKLAAAMQAGTPPDLFQSWGGGVLKAYVDAGLMQDIAESGKDFLGTLSPASVGVYSFDGKTYAAPWSQGMIGFWYNKDLFAKANVEIPKTWTEYLTAVKNIKDAGITPIALGNKDKWPGHFWWSYLNIRIGGKPAFDAAFNRTGSFADAPFVEAGAKLKKLIDLQPFPKGFEALDYDQHAAIMGNGEAAMELMGQWGPGNQKDKSKDKQGIGDKLGFFTFPGVEGGQGDASDVLGGCDGIAVSKNAPSGAIAFLKFFCNVENAKLINAGGGTLSTVAGSGDTIPDPLLKEVAERANAAKYFQVYYDQYLPPATGEAVKDTTQALFIAKMTPEQVAQGVEAAAATELKK